MKRRRKLLCGLLLLLAAVLLAGWRTSQGSIGVKADADALVVHTPFGESETIPFSEIERVELLHGVHYGEKIRGNENRYYFAGTWKNALWGEYRLCVQKSADACIAITHSGGVLALNYQNDETTAELAKAIEAELSGKP